MKAIICFILGSFLAVQSHAQTTSTVNIIFKGISKDTKNYQVMIDGKSYYSNTNDSNVPNYTATLTDIPTGTHNLKLYRLRNNDPAYNTRRQVFVYSKDFQLREGFDMNITVLPSGRVQFSEHASPVVNNPYASKTPMTDYQFSQLLNNVNSKYSQALKVGVVRDALANSGNYFSTAQLRQLLALVTSENDRLDLAKLSYRGVTDPNNFAQLADLFSSTANRNDFNNYVGLNSGQYSNNASVTAMTSYDFNVLLQNVQNRRSQALRVNAIRDAFTNTDNYFTTAQVRQLLTLVSSEPNRLDLVKLAYRGVTDPNNFTQLADLFSSTAYRNEFNNYASLNAAQYNHTAGTQMGTYEFNQLLQNVQSQWSQSAKAELLRNAFTNTNNYFSTAQIRQLLPLITSESDRLDLAKLSFRGVTDPANYAQLADMFYSSTYKNEFISYAGISTGQAAFGTGTRMADYQFNQLLQSVQNNWSQSLKAEAIRNAFVNTNNFFSTSQIRQLLLQISAERDRLDLVKLSYRAVTDPDNFAQLADLFYDSTYRTEFNNYVGLQSGQTTNTTVRSAMSDIDFSVLVLSVRANLLQFLKVAAERDIFNNPNNFFTASQAKELISLINSESNKLELAKLSYHTLVDPDNYTVLYDLFDSQASKDELASYVKANPVSSF